MTLPEVFRRKYSPIALTGLSLIVLAAAGLGGFFSWQSAHPSIPTVPKDIAQKSLFPIYLPTTLPGGFTIDPTTFRVEEGALLFYAANSDGDKITFSEQAKPTDFDFAAFNQKSLRHAISLPNTPYASIEGLSENDLPLLSIQADSTWIIITSRSARADDYFTSIAKQLKRQ